MASANRRRKSRALVRCADVDRTGSLRWPLEYIYIYIHNLSGWAEISRRDCSAPLSWRARCTSFEIRVLKMQERGLAGVIALSKNKMTVSPSLSMTGSHKLLTGARNRAHALVVDEPARRAAGVSGCGAGNGVRRSYPRSGSTLRSTAARFSGRSVVLHSQSPSRGLGAVRHLGREESGRLQFVWSVRSGAFDTRTTGQLLLHSTETPVLRHLRPGAASAHCRERRVVTAAQRRTLAS